jgi:hypothetical protein
VSGGDTLNKESITKALGLFNVLIYADLDLHLWLQLGHPPLFRMIFAVSEYQLWQHSWQRTRRLSFSSRPI